MLQLVVGDYQINRFVLGNFPDEFHKSPLDGAIFSGPVAAAGGEAQ